MAPMNGNSNGSSSSSIADTHRTPLRPTPMRPSEEPRSAKTINQASHNQQYASSAHLHPSSVSTKTSSSSSEHHRTGVPHTSSGFMSHFNQLLPKHATFRVRVTAHQLASVPLVHGEFALRWKFRSVQHGNKGLLGISTHSNNKGKAKDVHMSDSDDHDDFSDLDDGSLNGPLRASIESTRDRPPLHSNSHSHSQLGLSNLTVRPSTARPTTPSTQAFPSTPNGHKFPSSTSRTPPSPPEAISHSPARGRTPYVKLVDHNVTWEHHLDVALKWDVNRETGALGGGKGSEMKLVVMQRVVAGDPDAPHQPRLGAVYINLAEYADQGPITRRYLLSESKTNATLKLTITVDYWSGENSYVPPPLPKGEILGGIEGLLDSDIYRTRPRALDLYGMYYSHSAHVAPMQGGKKVSERARTKSKGHVDLNKDLAAGKLSSAFGPKTTEALIEALFNPVPTTEDVETPFTYRAVVPQPSAFNIQDDRRSDSTRSIAEMSLGSGSGGSVSSRAQSTFPRTDTSESHLGPGPVPVGSMSSRSSIRSAGSYQSEQRHPNPAQLHRDRRREETVTESSHKNWWQKLGHGTPSRPRTPTVK